LIAVFAAGAKPLLVRWSEPVELPSPTTTWMPALAFLSGILIAGGEDSKPAASGIPLRRW